MKSVRSLTLVVAATLAGRGAAAAAAIGDQILDPQTGQNETIVQVVDQYNVLTDKGNVIFLATTVGSTVAEPGNPTLTVQSITKNAQNQITQVTLVDGANPPNTYTKSVVTNVSNSLQNIAGAAGNSGGTIPVTIPTGNTNVFADAQVGSQGSGGSNGYGIEICIFKCFTIGYSGSSGGDGGPGPTINDTVTVANNGNIQSTSNNLPGITVRSVGGNGGNGGDAYGSLPSLNGGAAGYGGTVTLTSRVDVSTSGINAYGIFAQSQGGSGGSGGSGYILSDGGSGGPASFGTTVTVTNVGAINTSGDGAIGIVAQSLGGKGGSGGDSYGLVGDANSGSYGGNGGNVYVVNFGNVTTTGRDARGILAQSIGGSGGNSGNAGGIVAFGASGANAGGGNGGDVSVRHAAGRISTAGNGATGIFAQSIGGGGGSAGYSAGLVALGASGGQGGNGGAVVVTTLLGSSVATSGNRADAILAESIGGGGGQGGTGGGLVGIGGTGSTGGTGGSVAVTNGGVLSTAGASSRGIFAQSIGGGGGSGGDGGGLIAIGGSGSVASNAGAVTVANTGSITTVGTASQAIFAQSIGGGGGDGGSSYGSFTVGGTGGGGGNGGTVILNDSGRLQTSGANSQGIFAQSVGGGGGNGGNAAAGSAFAGVSVGGSAGNGGYGSAVTLNFTPEVVTINNVPQSITPQVLTTGDQSNGVFAQSIGGGGGNGGYAIQGTVGVGASIAVSVGGSGGHGGNGGSVGVNGDVAITTRGWNSAGLQAESVGGGGGRGGLAAAVSLSGGTGAFSASVGVGGSGGDGGNGGDVTLRTGGSILTTGAMSTGLIVQSVGGGGGSGGYSISVAGSGGAVGSASVAVGVGGYGGNGGAGGLVDAQYAGTVTTAGSDATGILLESVGGGGGSGAFDVSSAVSGAGSASGAITVGVGGSGGGGGNGGVVQGSITITSGALQTTGDRSAGLIAQSVGGDGGNGGFNVSGSIGASGTGSAAVSVGVGGSGGGAGSGSAVTVALTGNTMTSGSASDGVLVQSIGGGGGNGGFNVSGTIAAGGTGSGAVSVGVGGAGGGGGNGGIVMSTVHGSITTAGNQSDGLVVQSIGGGGGRGAFDVTGGISVAGSGSGALSIGVGGAGGAGGDGGNVTSTLQGVVATQGQKSHGVIVQSLGGSGGNGGFNVSGSVGVANSGAGSAAIGVGGFGGGGGSSGSVSSSIVGNISTSGETAPGLVVQSLGGGGGNGALNVSGAVAASTSGAGSVGVGVGGFGGKGGTAGTVTSHMTGNITTASGFGALIQSVGGGGGSGGLDVTGTVTLGRSAAGSIGLGIGGFGGAGGNGAAVTGYQSGNITTASNASAANAGGYGLLVQSAGGGGGAGAINVSGGLTFSAQNSGAVDIGIGGFGGGGGSAGDVTFTVTGNTATNGGVANGIAANGIVLQSVGGGGGAGAINVSGGISASMTGNSIPVVVGVGGFGGGAGNAGNVTGTVTGDVHVYGTAGSGVVAQSIGGAGGQGAINVSSGISLGTLASSNYALTLGVGGGGGQGGNAGTVNLTVTSQNIEAGGDNNYAAVVAQSIGGGGGNGGINVSGGVAMNGSLTAGVGGFGGGGGFGSAVTANVTGALSAAGASSRGLVVQSIGGGGGDGGINISGGLNPTFTSNNPTLVFGLGGFGGAGNSSGDVTATQSGKVDVTGGNSIGVLAQSVAGGGGVGALNVTGNLTVSGYNGAFGIGGTGGSGGTAGNVRLTSDGEISVKGAGGQQQPGLPGQAVNFAERANGILVQSIGGGGGNGGIDATGVIGVNGSPLVAGVGGTGGAGGNAGTVTVLRGQTTASSITTWGDQANGLTAQSIGGGGGTAGMNFVLSLSPFGDTSTKTFNLAVGGSGGASGNASAVRVDNTGSITTNGQESVGLLAQSIGGGGGSANYNLGFGLSKNALALNLAVGGGTGSGNVGGNVTVSNIGAISTAGDNSQAIFAQSVGGGGGNTALSMLEDFKTSKAVKISIGGTGGRGGEAGDVTVTSDGALSTQGAYSVGLLAQSIGGGGGESGATSVGLSSKSPEGTPSQTTSVGLDVGLMGGTGGAAGTVTVTASGSISTANDQAHAIFAQSVGGGGGIGGAALTDIIGDSNAARVGVGGSGGTGGTAGQVVVTNAATIETTGPSSQGIFAQSIGGGGGTGGYAGSADLVIPGYNTSTSAKVNASISIGGSGGNASAGNTVNVTNTGGITTTGKSSSGIYAQSIGGGGGMGGIAVDVNLDPTANATSNNTLSVAVGGTGGTGGASAAVTVMNQGTISTQGIDSMGIRAQSIGGGGGDGGGVLNLSLVQSRPDSYQSASIAIGGSGGSGGTSADVNVTNAAGASITTQDLRGYGIFAQSIGGGGGNGNSVVSATIDSGKQNVEAGINIGGFGGSGNHAGTVTVTNDGTITTTGQEAHGIFAQSVGGGGGNGGFVLALNAVLSTTGKAPLIAIGGSGGAGNDAGDVTVTNHGSITTSGAGANGIFAQSIGGGGGNAALGLSAGTSVASMAIANTVSYAAGILSSGKGLVTGGKGGVVTITNTGDITVSGEGALAYKAESINGGGGDISTDFRGLSSIVKGTPLFSADPGAVAADPVIVNTGGSSNVTGAGAGKVVLHIDGTVRMLGNNGGGSIVQGIGGGGGNIATNLSFADALSAGPDPLKIQNTLGGIGGSGNVGGTVDSTQTGNSVTTGTNSPGTLLQSIGGGGGRASISLSSFYGTIGGIDLTLGGTGGSDNSGGAIKSTLSGSSLTTGNQSFGVLALSIGGGGGLTNVTNKGQQDPNATLGSNGGLASNGGPINAVRNGNTTTTGNNATALFYQSVGGGGGTMNLAGLGNLNVAIGGSGGASGDGGAITLVNTGDVSTSGQRSHGIFLQSVGGGGGAVFTDTTSIVVTASAANYGNGGVIALNQTGNIATQGAQSYGIFAQSLGGGGGYVDGAFTGTAGGTGAGGMIGISVNGAVQALGSQSVGLYAQSSGQAGGNISVSLGSGGMIVGGTGGTGVQFAGGASNTLTNSGTVTTVDLVNGMAIGATSGNNQVANNSLVVGSVSLGNGTNTFNNNQGAVFYSGATVNLGTGGLLTNDGTILPGGTGAVLATSVTGNFEQSGTGVYGVKLDLKPNLADFIHLSGTASVNGLVTLNILDPGYAQTGDHQLKILTADGGVTDHSGLTLKFVPSAVASYSLLYPNATDVVLDYNLNFSPRGLSANEGSVGSAINTIQTARNSPAFSPIVAAIYGVPTVSALKPVYDALSGEGIITTQQTARGAGQMMLSTMASQVMTGGYNQGSWQQGGWPSVDGGQAFGAPSGLGMGSFGGQGYGPGSAGVAGDETSSGNPVAGRGWAVSFGGSGQLAGDQGVGTATAKQYQAGFAGGAHFELDKNIRVGFATAETKSSFSVADRATQGDVTGIHGGVYGLSHWGTLYASGMLSFAHYQTDTRRWIATGILPTELAKGHLSETEISARLEAGWRQQLKGSETTYLTPYAAIEIQNLRQGAFSEASTRVSGGAPGMLGLRYDALSTTPIRTFLGFQADSSFVLANGWQAAPFLRASWIHDSATPTGTASFLSAPGTLFSVQGALAGPNVARFEAGLRLNVADNDNLSFFGGVAGDVSGNSHSFSGTGGVNLRW